jgi:hypothetical protein
MKVLLKTSTTQIQDGHHVDVLDFVFPTVMQEQIGRLNFFWGVGLHLEKVPFDILNFAPAQFMPTARAYVANASFALHLVWNIVTDRGQMIVTNFLNGLPT